MTFVQSSVCFLFENAANRTHTDTWHQAGNVQGDDLKRSQFHHSFFFCPCLPRGGLQRFTNWRLLRACRDPVCFGGIESNILWWGYTACFLFRLLHKPAIESGYFYLYYFPYLIRTVFKEEAAKAFREIQRVTVKKNIKTSGLLFREDWWAIECLNHCTGLILWLSPHSFMASQFTFKKSVNLHSAHILSVVSGRNSINLKSNSLRNSIFSLNHVWLLNVAAILQEEKALT